MNIDFTTLRNQLESGTKKGYDLYGTQLSSYDAVKTLNEMSNHSIGKTMSESVRANIALSADLISIVRHDVLSVSLTSLGLTAVGLMAKLSNAIMAIQVGMFVEAAQILLSLTPDAFLTTPRLTLYASLLTSSDALTQNGYSS